MIKYAIITLFTPIDITYQFLLFHCSIKGWKVPNKGDIDKRKFRPSCLSKNAETDKLFGKDATKLMVGNRTQVGATCCPPGRSWTSWQSAC